MREAPKIGCFLEKYTGLEFLATQLHKFERAGAVVGLHSAEIDEYDCHAT